MTTPEKTRRKLSLVDVFAGPGGLSIGFKLSGYFEPVAAVDVAKVACNTYEQNMSIPVFHENLAETNLAKLNDCAHKKGFDQIDVIIGGPPCKAFTTANRGGTKWEKVKEKLLEENKAIENSEWFSFWKVIQGIKPRAFVAENVMGLRTRKDVLQKFVERVNLFGYATAICELDAQYFGVPQRRKRIFVIGQRDSDIDPADLIVKNPKKKSFKPISVEKAINDLPELSNEKPGCPISKYLKKRPTAYQALLKGKNKSLFDHVVHRVHPIVASRFKYIPQGYNLRKAWVEELIPEENMRAEYLLGKVIRKFSEKTLENMHSNIYRRLKWKSVSCTITNARKTVLVHPLQDRLLSVREVARLQSFPDWIRFCGSLDQQYQQIADAVPPLLAKGIANHLADLLQREKTRHNSSVALVRRA